jgi:hypothetical protein
MTMADKDDTARTHRKLNQNVPAETSNDVSAETPRIRLQQTIDVERARLLQVSCVLHCLYEVLLYAEGDEAVTYAEVAHLAANLIDDSVARLDSVCIGPMIEAIRSEGEKERGALGGPYEVREPCAVYMN